MGRDQAQRDAAGRAAERHLSLAICGRPGREVCREVCGEVCDWERPVTPETAAGLRTLAEALPTGAVVPVPREWLLELLEGQAPAASANTPMDPTVEAVASRYGRAPSTVRGWCEAGRFPGAYKLHDREWRIPAAALDAFEAKERQRERPAGRGGRGVRSLGDWRQASGRPA